MTEKETIVLASASPRRQELLRQIGFAFRVVVSDAEELSGDSISPDRLAEENARRKAKDVAAKESGNVPVLGADTVVAVDGMILGKPKDAADAARMLRLLSGRQHFVYTGITLAYKGEVYEDVVRTEVWVDELSEKEIDAYIATGEPMDKAGAYGIQGKGELFISSVEGSYSNVVGLPMQRLYSALKELGVL